MKKGQFTVEQIIKILQEEVNEAKHLRELQEENRRLKRLVADQALNIQVLKDILGKKP